MDIGDSCQRHLECERHRESQNDLFGWCQPLSNVNFSRVQVRRRSKFHPSIGVCWKSEGSGGNEYIRHKRGGEECISSIYSLQFL